MDRNRKQLRVQCPFPAPPPSCPLLTPPAGNYGLAIKLCAQPALIWQGLALEQGIWQERNGTEPHGDAEHQGDAGLGWGTRGEQLDVGISCPPPEQTGLEARQGRQRGSRWERGEVRGGNQPGIWQSRERRRLCSVAGAAVAVAQPRAPPAPPQLLVPTSGDPKFLVQVRGESSEPWHKARPR